MSQIHPHIRGIYPFLKKHNFESFTKFKKNVFESVLIKFGLQNPWYNIKEREWASASIMHPFTGDRSGFDKGFMLLLNIAYKQSWFLIFIDNLLDVFLTSRNIENFEYDEFKQIIIKCGFEETDIEEMKFWENEGKIKKKKRIIPEINEFALGTLDHLEKTLIHKIYEWILSNPTILHKKNSNIPPQRRKAVKIRDKFICQMCIEEFKEEKLQVDHIFPYSLGGSNEETNLMALWEECNGNKAARIDYYRNEEGKLKIMENIKEFVKTLLMIHNFGYWLEKMGDKRRRKNI